MRLRLLYRRELSAMSAEPTSVPEPWVSMKEICAHLGVNRDTVIVWTKTLGLPGVKTGCLWKFKPSEVDAWMRGLDKQGN